MFKFTLITALSILIFSVVSSAQTFPKTAVILERKQVTPAREFVLWMTAPTENPRDPQEIYTCPEETRGHYYSGKASVSLIDTKTKKIINTLAIAPSDESDEKGLIDLPYLIHESYYSVPKVNKNKEGKPVLLDLKDYNDDGKPQEFALFDALACMGLNTTLIGYSEKQDKVIQYPLEIKTADGTFQALWLDYFFSHEPVKKQFWKYQVDYRGRGGTLDEYEIKYDAAKEKFFGTLKSTEDDND